MLDATLKIVNERKQEFAKILSEYQEKVGAYEHETG